MKILWVRPSGVMVINFAHTSGQVGMRAEGEGPDRTGWVCLSRLMVVERRVRGHVNDKHSGFREAHSELESRTDQSGWVWWQETRQ